MLKRIQEIYRVGCFREDRPAGVEFSGLTFVFGENCYGKSTLCDVLRSVGENRPDYVTQRLSVPRTVRDDQRVRLTFLHPGSEQESVVSFGSDRWTSGPPGSLKLYVFDTEFIHRNVFTGLSVERQNQENVTRFILGEEGVARAEEIAALRAKIRRLKKDLRSLESGAFEGIKDLAEFLSLQVTEVPAEISEKIVAAARTLDRARQLAVKMQEVKDMAEPQPILVSEGLDLLVKEINDCLRSGFEQSHHSAADAVERHIASSTRADTTTKDWLKKGLRQLVKDRCPFCSQSLRDDAHLLLNAYRSYFDEAFDSFADDLHRSMASYSKRFAVFLDTALPESLQSNARCAERYQTF